MHYQRLPIAVMTATILWTSSSLGTEKKLSVGSLDDGKCEVNFHVTSADKAPVQSAWVSIKVRKTTGGEDNVAINTNSDGRAQFLGLPDTGMLHFTVRNGGHVKHVSLETATVCGSVAEVVFP